MSVEGVNLKGVVPAVVEKLTFIVGMSAVVMIMRVGLRGLYRLPDRLGRGGCVDSTASIDPASAAAPRAGTEQEHHHDGGDSRLQRSRVHRA